jgi:three-Cys-motif partner protein
MNQRPFGRGGRWSEPAIMPSRRRYGPGGAESSTGAITGPDAARDWCHPGDRVPSHAMPRGEEARLFNAEDLLSEQELDVEAAEALAPGEGQQHPDLDAARLWQSREDGLLVRGVKPHSAEKSLLVSRSIDTVSSAMSGQWFTRKHGLEYLELYGGPGRLLNERTGEEQAGSPLQALAVAKPFTRYVFSDFSEDCVEALQARVGERANVSVLNGNANSTSHLNRVGGLLNPKALLIAYLDPARPQDLHWSTVQYLAEHFGYVDLIVNLPVNSLVRSILGAHSGGGTGSGTAGRFLNHASPSELLVRAPTGKLIVGASIAAIRDHYDEQLISLGFKKPARRTIEFPASNPYYDVLYVSRHETGVKLWDRTNPPPDPPPTLF